MSIQDHVVAVVRFREDQAGAVHLEDVLGTAFFIDDRGTFLTATSALLAGFASGPVGLAVRLRDAPRQWSVAPLLDHETAESPWDVAVGRVDVASRGSFVLAGIEAAPLIWQHVHALGCVALPAATDGPEALPVFRAWTGNVLREVANASTAAPPRLETSFVVSAGMRGAPIFLAERPRARLVGLCVGNDSLGPLTCPRASDGGEPWSVPDLHGVAHDLRALAHWRPACMDGASLRECIGT